MEYDYILRYFSLFWERLDRSIIKMISGMIFLYPALESGISDISDIRKKNCFDIPKSNIRCQIFGAIRNTF